MAVRCFAGHRRPEDVITIGIYTTPIFDKDVF